MNDAEAKDFLEKVFGCPKNALHEYIAFLQKQSGVKDGHIRLVEKIQTRWKEYFFSQNFSSPKETFHCISENLHAFDDALIRFSGIGMVRDQRDFFHLLDILHAHLPQEIFSGSFLSEDAALRFLGAQPSKRLLRACGGVTLDQAREQCDVFTLFSTLRFMEDEAWMQRFLQHYDSLSPQDFEQREVHFLPLSAEKWGDAAQDFSRHKLHPFSHLKELGVLFFVFSRDRSFALTPFLLLFLHYIYEIRFYSEIFQNLSSQKNFGALVKNIICGDTAEMLFDGARIPILQQYHLKKDAPPDYAFLPHVHSETLHWHKALSTLVDWIYESGNGDFRNFLSFDPVMMPLKDAILTLNVSDVVVDRFVPKRYHAHEALWNALFSEFFSSQHLEEKIQKFFSQKYISFS